MKHHTLIAVAIFTLSASVVAAPPSERILPDTTRAYFSTPDVAQLEAAWGRTNFARIGALPEMQSFIRDLHKQQRMPWDEVLDRLGLTLDDVRRLAGGETCGAVVPTAKKEAAYVLLVNASGKQPQAQELLARIAAGMRGRGATAAAHQVAGTRVIAYQLPRMAAGPASQRCFALYGDLFVAANDLQVMTTVVQRAGGAASDVLANLPAFQAVEARWRTGPGPVEHQLRWFVDPMGMASLSDVSAAIAAAPSPTPKSKSKPKSKSPTDEAAKFLARHGFDALRGMGGTLALSTGEYDVFARIAFFAPQPHRQAMRIFGFQPGGQFAPHAWVPAAISSYATFHLNMRQSFDSFAGLFDELYGEGEQGVFDDVIDSIKTDPSGPGVDLRTELFDRLGSRGAKLGDSQDPVGPKSDRTVFAVETTDPQAAAVVLSRLMQGDPGIARREVNGHTLWQTQNLVSDPEQRVPNTALTVAHGHLMVATHVELLEQILRRGPVSPALADDPSYQRITERLDQLAGQTAGLRMFTRTADDYRATYELLRLGRLHEAESITGKLFRALQGKRAKSSKTPPNGKLLPDYSQIRDHLVPAGAVGTIHEDGWLLTGFMLQK